MSAIARSAITANGVGELSVAAARAARFGSRGTAPLRTALTLGPPPHFEGLTCVDVGCGRKHGLQFDHVDPVANNGPTAYWNLAARCRPSHLEKTERDRRAGLLGPKVTARARAPAVAIR